MAPRESSKPSALSDEYVVDSSDDQAGPGSVQSQKAGATPRVKQRSSAKPKEPKRRKTTSPSTEPSSRSQSLEEDDQDGEDEEDEDEEDEDEPQLADLLDESATQASRKPLSDKDRPKRRAKTITALERSIPAKQYEPPSGFVRHSAVVADSSSDVFNRLTNDLTGKQIWHISAPADVSLESLRAFPIEAALNEKPILNSDGKSYCFTEGPSTAKFLLTPNESQDGYVPSKTAISRAFHLREMVNPPVKSRGTEANRSRPIYFEFQLDDKLPQRTKRTQPEGLRMRYRPFGTIHLSPGEFDAERSDIYIPDQIVTPPVERHKKRKKAYKGHVSPLAQQDSDPMEVEASQARPELQTVSPGSIRPSQHSPSKQAVTGKGLERQEEKKKKKKKKHKDREASST